MHGSQRYVAYVLYRLHLWQTIVVCINLSHHSNHRHSRNKEEGAPMVHGKAAFLRKHVSVDVLYIKA